jgi:DNA-binding beta-propeller fold protein YncE
MSRLLILALISLSLQLPARAQFEARHVHPVALTPDGTHLLAVNSPDASLSIFDVTNPARPAPMLVTEIAVGLEPVSVKARTPDEVWVVNELSDSVSIVSLSGRRVIDTLSVPDEPADVTFAAGKAFVTCSRNNLIRVFDAATRLPLGSIPLTGLHPRALAASADGSRLATADKVGRVVVWDVAARRALATLDASCMYTWDPKQRRHSIGGVRSLAFSPDGRMLAAGGIGQIGNMCHSDHRHLCRHHRIGGKRHLFQRF